MTHTVLDDERDAQIPPFSPYYADLDEVERKHTPRRRTRVAVALVAAGALVGGTGGVLLGTELHSTGSATSAAVAPAAPDPGSYAPVAAKVLPSVVSIDVSGSGMRDTGSGVVIRADGYILTNNHVVAAAANGGSVHVTFNDGSTVPASIVGTDPASDLAVVRVSKTGLPAAALGSSGDVRVGDRVLAIGSPLGLSGTVTEGIVSSLNRPVNTTSASSATSLPTVIDAIQTDAAINPGNSGGALVNMSGQVIGINSAIATLGATGGQSGNIGVGFAIPIDQAKSIADQLIASGHATHPMLGVSVADAATASGTAQVVVRQVQAGSPAAKAGLRAGDVITALDGKNVTDADALVAAVRSHSPGDSVQVTYLRGGSRHTVSVQLTEAGSGK